MSYMDWAGWNKEARSGTSFSRVVEQVFPFAPNGFLDVLCLPEALHSMRCGPIPLLPAVT
jgi:hypothetical protein